MKPYYSLSDFPDRKNAGKNFLARCPKCGTMHLYISKAKGLYHCFYAGCEFNGILTDYCKDKRPMFSYPKEKSSDRTGTYPPPRNAPPHRQPTGISKCDRKQRERSPHAAGRLQNPIPRRVAKNQAAGRIARVYGS